MKHGNKGKITGFARTDNWLNKRRKEVKRCHDCNKIMDGVPLAIGTYHCWDCIDE